MPSALSPMDFVSPVAYVIGIPVCKTASLGQLFTLIYIYLSSHA